MREFIDVTAEMAAHSKALDAIAKAIAQGNQVVSTISWILYWAQKMLPTRMMHTNDMKEVWKLD